MLCEIDSLTVECHKGSHLLVPVEMQALKQCLFGCFTGYLRLAGRCRVPMTQQTGIGCWSWWWILRGIQEIFYF